MSSQIHGNPPVAQACVSREPISWISLIRTARVSYGFLALVAAGLLLPGQMRDMLAALTDSSNVPAIIAFPFFLAVFGITCWYWGRAAISARFDLPDTKKSWDQIVEEGQQGKRPAIERSPLHLVPQAPIPIAGLIGLWLAFRSGAYVLGTVSLVFLVALWWFINQRRTIRDALRKWANRPSLDEDLPLSEDPKLRSTTSLSEWSKLIAFRLAKLMERAPFGPGTAKTILGVSLTIFVVSALSSFFPAARSDDPRNWIWTLFQGPTPVLLGCALMIGPLTAMAFVADGWRPTINIGDAPIGLSRPPVMSVLALISGMVPLIFTLHSIRTLPGAPAQRSTLQERWNDWKAACGDEDTRPIIVAISGGASRAGLWGAAVLAEVEKRAAGQNAALFAISSVSGGSLGAAAYMGVRASETDQIGGPHACQMTRASMDSFSTFAQQLGAADEVGPLLSGYLFSDVPRSLLGWLPALLGADLAGGDRGAAIERSFEANARVAARDAKITTTSFDEPFLSLAAKKTLPLWIANGTERDTGSRALTIAINSRERPTPNGQPNKINPWPFRGASDVLAQLGTDVPISTAINNTARFPFLEPAGKLLTNTTGKTGVSLIDGGYFDNSGLETALELAAWLELQRAKPIVVVASGDGEGDGIEVKTSKIQPESIVRCGSPAYSPEKPRSAADVYEGVAPLIGLNQVRVGHVDILLRRAADQYCQKGSQSFFHFYLPGRGTESVPLNWVLSKTMACHIWRSASGTSTPACAAALGGKDDAFIDANLAEAASLAKALQPR
jgi:hypothetical protein